MSKENNFELNKFCPNCKTSLSLFTNDKYYYCNKTGCSLHYYYYFDEDKISMDEFIHGYGWIYLKNKNEMIDDLELYKYVLDEENLTSSEIVQKYNEFKENLIFL